MKACRAIALVFATGAVVAACGDPGLPTPGLALANDRDGDAAVVVQACEEFTALELGPGDDFWGRQTVVLQTEEPERHAVVDLVDAEGFAFRTGRRRRSRRCAPRSSSGCWRPRVGSSRSPPSIACPIRVEPSPSSPERTRVSSTARPTNLRACWPTCAHDDRSRRRIGGSQQRREPTRPPCVTHPRGRRSQTGPCGGAPVARHACRRHKGPVPRAGTRDGGGCTQGRTSGPSAWLTGSSPAWDD